MSFLCKYIESGSEDGIYSKHKIGIDWREWQMRYRDTHNNRGAAPAAEVSRFICTIHIYNT